MIRSIYSREDECLGMICIYNVNVTTRGGEGHTAGYTAHVCWSGPARQNATRVLEWTHSDYDYG